MTALWPLALAMGTVDHPGGRRAHNGVVLVIGGLALFAGLALAAAVRGDLGNIGCVVLSAAALMVFVGAMDDGLDLGPSVRLVSHAIAPGAQEIRCISMLVRFHQAPQLRIVTLAL